MTALEIAGSDLLELAARVEVGIDPAREQDAEVAVAVGWSDGLYTSRWLFEAGNSYADLGKYTGLPDYTASIDAVATLLPSWAFPLLDWTGCHCRLRNSLGIDFPEYTGLAPTPARAMLAAVLRCLVAQMPARSLLKDNSDANG